MRHGPHRTLVVAALGSVLLTGCSTVVPGSASPGGHVVTDVSPQDFPITAATDDDPVDQAARNSLSDLYTFWGQAYPDAFGEDFQPLQGGIYSVDLANLGESQFPDGVGCGADPPTSRASTSTSRTGPGPRTTSSATSPWPPRSRCRTPWPRDQAGLSTDDSAATRSAVCLTGWWEAQVFSGRDPTVRLQPGDVDEAVSFLLTYGSDPQVFPDTALSGFELLRAFRSGFLQGGSQCDAGL